MRLVARAWLFIALPAAAADLPDLAPSVRSLFPLGGRPGESVELKISGRNLERAQEIAFARPDIRAELLSSDFFAVRAKVSVGSKVPSGLHDYRLRTPHGTYVGVLHVSSLAALREAEPNNDIAKAQPVTLPVIIDGVAEQGDYDFYRFHAEAGETLIFDLLATRAGSRLDGTLAVLDARGNELDFADDSYIHKDAHLAFPVRQTGDYLLRVMATSERGSPQSSYRVAAGGLPYVRRMLPAGARRGATAELEVRGVNLARVDRVVLGDALAEATVLVASPDSLRFRLAVPDTVTSGRYELHVFAGSLEAPVAIPLLVSDLEERLSASARSRAQPQPITAPVALSGALDRRRAADFFAFDARAGQRLAFEVDAMKLGYLVDPFLAVYTPEGELVAFDDDRLQQNGSEPPNLDPYLVHTFDKGGRYIAMLRDTAQRGDPNYVYRMAVYPVEPDFDLKALTPAVTIYRGRTGLLTARVRRLGGWSTPVEVTIDGLPPGVTTEPKVAEPKPTIVKDNCALERRLDGTNVDLPLHVAADAPLGLHPIRVRARGMMDGKAAEHHAEILYRWESVGKITGPIAEQKLVAAVTDLPAVLLEPPESVTVMPGKTARLRVLVKRFEARRQALTLEADPPLDGVKLENNVTPADADQIELRLTAASGARGGTLRLRAGEFVSPPIEIKVGKAEAQPEAEP